MNEKHPVQQLADMVGGTITSAGQMPDGSGFATMSMPLLKTHWIYERGADSFSLPPPMPFRMGIMDPRYKDWHDKVRAAGKYAVRAATMNGQEMDFDPDALIQNLLVGMFGYHTIDGLSHLEDWMNPDPAPELFPPAPGDV